MSNTLYIPEANPIHFVPVNPNTPGSYATRFFDAYVFADTLRDFEQPDKFFMPWYKNDRIHLQFQANFAPLQLDVQDCDLNTVLTVTAAQVRANRYQPGFYIYEASIDVSSLPDGAFRILLTPGEDDSAAQKSEWLQLSLNTENTIFLEYFNSRFKDDVVYETGIRFGLRVPGFLQKVAPGSVDQLYKDQILNQSTLSSKPFKNWKVFIGDGRGVPESLIEKVNRAYAVDNISHDGRLLAKADGAKWTEATEDKKRLVGYTMDLVEGLNRPSRIVNPDLNTNIRLIVQYNIEAGVFGDTSGQAGENTVSINYYE
ncbi:hypothetical protein [Puia sp.]|jgi:hypothetical protein|uniref:hypothetical protein n=1 Tax=Puia sp. TaxID=2045100 RepID=UPI002F3E5A23